MHKDYTRRVRILTMGAPDNNRTPEEVLDDRKDPHSYSLPADDEEFMEKMANRQNSILTENNRRYLSGNKTYEDENNEIQERKRIRSRVRNGLMDGLHLAYGIDERDRRTIFNPNTEKEPQEQVLLGAQHWIQFLYMGVRDVGIDFEQVLSPAIKRAEQDAGWMNVDVSFNVNRDQAVDTQAAWESYEAGESLSDEQLGALLLSNSLTREQKQDLRQQAPSSMEDSDTTESKSEKETYKEIVKQWNPQKDEHPDEILVIGDQDLPAEIDSADIETVGDLKELEAKLKGDDTAE